MHFCSLGSGHYGSLMSAPNLNALYEYTRCKVWKKCSQCVVIKFLNKTFASLPRKKIQSSNRFLDVISWEYDNSCA